MKKRVLRYTLIILTFFTCLFIAYLLTFTDILTLGNNEKLILIGIDAAEWEVINQLIDEGKLPHFKSFIEQGSYGALHSPYCYSPISWTEIFTGKTKEKHGINDFTTPDRTRLNNRYDVKAKRTWDYLNDNNVTAGVYKHYFTWPAKKVNGFIVTDSNPNSAYHTYPESLSKTKYPRKFSSRSINSIPEDCEIILKLFDAFKPEFYTFFDGKIHMTTHSYWKYFEPSKFNLTDKKEIDKGYEKIVKVYSKWDECLGLIEDQAKNYDILIVSDHGMGDQIPISYDVDFRNFFLRLGIENYTYNIFKLGSYLFIEPTDGKWESNFTINRPEDIGHIKRIFDEIFFLDGTKFFENITIVSDSIIVYVDENNFKKNLFLNSTKDSFILNYYIPVTIKSTNTTSFIDVWEKSGEHSPGLTPHQGIDGIILAKGPNINKNFRINNASVYDITPTILYLYNIPIPEDVDGRVLKEAIKPETRLWLFLKRIFRSSKPETVEEEESFITNISGTEDEELLNMLRSLGYSV